MRKAIWRPPGSAAGLALVAWSLPFEGNETLQTAKTWCEFEAKAPPGWHEDAAERLKDRRTEELYEEDGFDSTDEPAAEKRFVADEIPGYQTALGKVARYERHLNREMYRAAHEFESL